MKLVRKVFILYRCLDSHIPIKFSGMENGKSYEITCRVQGIETVFEECICLNKYLEGVEAYIDCSYKQINFAEHLSDINGCKSFYYSGETGLLDEEDGISIKDCVEDGKIYLLEVPIISEYDSSEFLKAYDVLEDYDEALDRIGKYESINICGTMQEVYDYTGVIDGRNADCIIGEYTISEFREQFEHDRYTPVKTSVLEQDVITNENVKVLPYNKHCVFGQRYSWRGTDKCYLKNVLLSDLKIQIPSLVDGVGLKGAVVNITNGEFVPNVSRSNISEVQQKKLSYAIGKAIHLWMRDNVELAADERELLNLFIQKEYSEDNSCLKKNM